MCFVQVREQTRSLDTELARMREWQNRVDATLSLAPKVNIASETIKIAQPGPALDTWAATCRVFGFPRRIQYRPCKAYASQVVDVKGDRLWGGSIVDKRVRSLSAVSLREVPAAASHASSFGTRIVSLGARDDPAAGQGSRGGGTHQNTGR